MAVERQFADEQRHGEADAGHDGDTAKTSAHVQVMVQLGAGEAGGQPGTAEDTDASCRPPRPTNTPSVSGLVNDVGRAPGRTPSTPGAEQREQRHGKARGRAPHQVLEDARRGVLLARPGGAAQHQSHGHAGDGGVDAAVDHQRPDDQRERQVDVPAADAHAQQQPEEDQAEHRRGQRREVDRRGEEDGDDQDREEVVDDGEGQQERAQRGGSAVPMTASTA